MNSTTLVSVSFRSRWTISVKPATASRPQTLTGGLLKATSRTPGRDWLVRSPGYTGRSRQAMVEMTIEMADRRIHEKDIFDREERVWLKYRCSVEDSNEAVGGEGKEREGMSYI